ncbi:hypothetical protein SCP_0502910 [Sparassis crispa]|uniref:SPRY domain-containing protein n=1 Tax=Sparassis crispa TaxID=139825 RepID=A0A401GM04_9APHY|nr:hypothetical protein SCP_0502910 [Sparassis crispa]GBE83243.1 hypothetical protein SCP_0502910 [Sparassis crispa]
MSWFTSKFTRRAPTPAQGLYAPPPGPPPHWQPAPERSHTFGLLNEATKDEYEAALDFCARNAPEPPRLLPSHIVDRIDAEGCRTWTLQWPRSPRFVGNTQNSSEKGGSSVVKVVTEKSCMDVCLLSDLPLLAGLYDIQGKSGVYYEILIHKMDGIIAVGTTCRPHPEWRLPGWDRLNVGLHLDDFRKFFEDPYGVRDYTDRLKHITPGDTIGCGYQFSNSGVFFTHNGVRLRDAFTGVYLPRAQHDVYAAIGVEGANNFDVNFGGDLFRWKEGNEWAWRVEGHVGHLSSGDFVDHDDQLPSYEEVRGGPANNLDP